ncbi:MAG: HutD family protein, partial [Paeniclostridium sordellii]|nr:HutD family protein [Paeniclostridium sordellii]
KILKNKNLDYVEVFKAGTSGNSGKNKKIGILNGSFKVNENSNEDRHLRLTIDSNIQRKLMLLDGNLILKHENCEEVNLNKFDIHTFSGELDTISYGKGIDFNLMTTNNCIGELEHIYIKSKMQIKLNEDYVDKKYKYRFICIYSLNNSFNIEIQNKRSLEIQNGEVVIIKIKINEVENLNIVNNGKTDLQIVKSTVHF